MPVDNNLLDITMRGLFKIIFRNFIHRPVTNLINLVGLSVSLTIVIILSVYSYSELTTDSFHENVDEVFLFRKNNDYLSTPAVLAEAIGNNIPGLKAVVRVTPAWGTTVFQNEDKEPLVSDLVFADKDFFKLFSYIPVEGDLHSALNEPLSMAISESLSAKLFGNESAIGRFVKYNNEKVFTVSAVFEEQEKNSCLRFNAVTSTATDKILKPGSGQFTEWGWNNYQTFFLLEKGQNQDDILRNLLQIVPGDIIKRDKYEDAKLIPLRKIYFLKDWVFGNYMIFGNLRKTVSLLMVAILVLLTALVNFINISASQWRERVKQFGIRKILGAGRIHIIREILAESFIFFLAALIFAIQLSSAVSPAVHNYAGISFSDSIIGSPGFILLAVIIVFILSIIFSIIPAVRISSSKAIDNLRKTVMPEKRDYSVNGVMVTMQFTIAIALISFTILVQKQVKFGTSTLGINQENIVVINMTPQLQLKKEVLRTALENEALIDQVSFSQFYPGGPYISNWGINMDLNGEKKMIFFDTFCADESFFSLMGLKLISGRLYSDSLSTDKDKVVVNESFLKKYDISDPAGLTFYTFQGTKAEIVGVIGDFHHKPVNTEIVPLVIRNEDYFSYCTVHFTSKDFIVLDKTISNIKTIVSELSPSFPVDVSFMDNAIQDMYNSELMFRRAFLLMAFCALLISCLGILAMSVSACLKRVKELGIRRVNGARASEILLMLNSDMIKWVMLALFISTPVSWYFMNLWLRNYAYKTPVSLWIFAASGVAAFLIAILTVSWQSWRAASRNPVEALRYE